MARNRKHRTPELPAELVRYYREELYRELAHMFEWSGLPQTVPRDYLERNLVRYGYVMYYEHPDIGEDILRAEVHGWNRHELPTTARTFTPTTNIEVTPQITRTVKRLADSENSVEEFDPDNDCVLIHNMAHGQNCGEIVEHFAERLALAQQAFDTNLLWANIPYIFQTGSDETKLSIEKMFADIFSGKPSVVVDKDLFKDNKDRAGVPSGIQFIGKELMDVQNEIKMRFKQTVGFDTAGVDKAERVNTMEIESNNQHTQSVLQVMLEQRQRAVESINAFYGRNITVDVFGAQEQAKPEQEEVEEDGTGDSGTGEAPGAY